MCGNPIIILSKGLEIAVVACHTKLVLCGTNIEKEDDQITRYGPSEKPVDLFELTRDIVTGFLRGVANQHDADCDVRRIFNGMADVVGSFRQ